MIEINKKSDYKAGVGSLLSINDKPTQRLSQANFRIERELWERFKLEARRREGEDASSILRRLIIDYLNV